MRFLTACGGTEYPRNMKNCMPIHIDYTYVLGVSELTTALNKLTFSNHSYMTLRPIFLVVIGKAASYELRQTHN